MISPTIKEDLHRQIEQYLAWEGAPYSREYVRSQAANALRHWLRGETPNGSCSDMLCDFWLHLPGKRKDRRSLVGQYTKKLTVV